ncbi:MAG: AraC family transcriptional regulator [Bacteroidaceae bacterium]
MLFEYLINVEVAMSDKQKEILEYKNNMDVNISYKTSPQMFPPHWHNSAEFVLALKDDCHYRINDVEYVLNSDNILLIWPRELHEVVMTPPEASLILQFPSYLADNNHDLILYQAYMRKYHLITAENLPEIAAAFNQHINQIKNLFLSDDIFAETKMKIYILEMLLMITDYAAKEIIPNREVSSPSESARGRINEACIYITNNMDQNITQPEVAKYVGLSQFYFSRLFKDCMQVSFREYLSLQRTSLAIQLLSNNTLSIAEVAYQAGFQSISSFNKVFKEKVGTSAKEYRLLYQHANLMKEAEK